MRGYTEAFDRFRDASQHPDSPEGLFVPLFEALNWAGALEEKLRPHTDPLLWAIRWVRNTVLHHWADAVEGRNVPNAYIAKPGASGPIPPAVDTHLSGKPVRLGLADLRQMF